MLTASTLTQPPLLCQVQLQYNFSSSEKVWVYWSSVDVLGNRTQRELRQFSDFFVRTILRYYNTHRKNVENTRSSSSLAATSLVSLRSTISSSAFHLSGIFIHYNTMKIESHQFTENFIVHNCMKKLLQVLTSER